MQLDLGLVVVDFKGPPPAREAKTGRRARIPVCDKVVLDRRGLVRYLDTMVSVSGQVEVEDSHG